MKNTTGKQKKKREKHKSHIPFRLNLLFLMVFLLFATLILRLGYLQIVQGEEFRAEVARTETTLATSNVPRGEIYDAQQRKLVGNKPIQTITYTRGTGVSSKDMAELAYKLAEYMEMPNVTIFENEEDYDLSKRDLEDYWLALHSAEVNERLSEEEKQLTGSELYLAQVDKVAEEDIQFDQREQEAAAIYKQMNSAYALTTINIKNQNVTNEEIAAVSENLSQLPGIDTGTDWVRTYPQGSMLRSILGTVSTEEQGVPDSGYLTYMAQGYARNDRVGRSNLELQYETVLKGSKAKSYTETNNNGDIINQTEQYPGEKGSNLVLTIDIAFQEQVEEIARQSLKENHQGLNDSIYVAAMDPRTGEILAMTGQKIDKETGEIIDDAQGVTTQAFEMGSSVKAATILAAQMDGVLTADNNVMIDTPLKIAQTPAIRSLFNQSGSVRVDDITALERSSNIYTAKLAMRMGGINEFQNGSSLVMDTDMVVNKMRKYYEMFGLGARTGIDLPNEQTGYKGQATQPGQALYFSFGQFDTYTTMQLLQYISTIANGGTRLAPRLVSEVRGTDEGGNVGPLKTEIEPRVLNTINVSEEGMERVHRGLYEVVNGDNGTARSAFAGAEYESAGKTGTAQALYFGEVKDRRGESVINKTYVGYAPYDDPKIAVAVVVPYLPERNTNYENTRVARRVMDAFFQVGEFENTRNENAAEENADDSAMNQEETDADANQEAETNEEE
ncbi:peptidoglycan D,D-transpeptidase FtsI family protein [Atopococcus tabaci]|uniref:peptidoglycan D,D-transpeptidase FtsI family protein n=1 Tax=Atopococcus tabaci TaxID=269774 RepID=UPI00041A9636|nr:penicillin-binding protein 2 [Atopococcus tabaci]